jgi:hypothetical protein
VQPTPEIMSAIEQDRERYIASARLARLAACVRSCCSTSFADRLARRLRIAPTSCRGA